MEDSEGGEPVAEFGPMGERGGGDLSGLNCLNSDAVCPERNKAAELTTALAALIQICEQDATYLLSSPLSVRPKTFVTM